jgi:leader peptidase (prepilin peptidase)/N-methyltransferase
MEGIWIIVFTLLGMVVASFLNVCIDRLPGGQSLLFPASHCASCHHRLAIKDLIPVFSYLLLRGRCRYCQAPIARRILWVEIGTGLLFGYLYWHYGLSLELAVAAVYCCLFIVLMVIDLEHGIIPNKIVYPAMAVALLISIFIPPSRLIYPGGAVVLLFNTFLPEPGIAQAAIGGGIGLVVFLLIVLISRGGMGWGDVKMATLIGIITGYLILVALFIAVIFGGLVAVTLLLLNIKKRKEGIPFAPFLSLATMATLLWGSSIVNCYLGLF